MVTDDQTAATRPRLPEHTPLGELVTWLTGADASTEVRGVTAGVRVSGVSLSSQRILPGDLYAALPGARQHGAEFAAAAVASGAVALLTDPAGAEVAGVDVPLLVVDQPRAVLGRLAAWVYGEPAAGMRMIGVTGTQGKTTTTRLADGGLRSAGVRSAVIGTVGTRVDGEEVKTALTTPEAPDLHGLFAMMRERGVEACAMEVSSHALVMGRVDGVVFDVAVFLNLGRDHLDFHRDLDDYFEAKASLFTPERARLALVNVDDDSRPAASGAHLHPGAHLLDRGADADWRVSDVGSPPRGRPSSSPRPPVTGSRPAARCRATSTCPTRSRPSLRPAKPVWTRRWSRRGSPTAVGSRAGSSGSTPVRTSSSSSTMPTSRTRSLPRSVPSAR